MADAAVRVRVGWRVERGAGAAIADAPTWGFRQRGGARRARRRLLRRAVVPFRHILLPWLFGGSGVRYAST